jgi:predicted HTH domain antitoxin
MMIDEETRRTIIDLYSSQHTTIRQIAKITRKSSRDITAILKERNGKSRTQAYEVDEKNHGLDSIEEPLNVKAYCLFSQGKVQ